MIPISRERSERRGEAEGRARNLGARLAALSLGCASLACASPRNVVDRLAAASTPAHMPHVVACWEKLVETSRPGGAGAVVVLGLTVEGGTSRVKDARVIRTTAVGSAEGDAGAIDQVGLDELGRCVQAAMNRTTLPTTADAGGPGFSSDSDVRVRNFRIAFTDASEKSRRVAAQRQSNILVGPRADRCQGLYGHEPPRDASTLYAEIAREQGRAQMHEGGDADQYARGMQKLFDLRLELRARLTLDVSAEGLPPANKKRIDKALREVEASATETGAKIGCKLPY
jgi:hypothetical protein